MTRTLRLLSILLLTLLIVCISLSVRQETARSVVASQINAYLPHASGTAYGRAYAPATTRLLTGVTTKKLASNAWTEWDSLDEVSDFESQLNQRVPVIMYYADWEHNHDFNERQANAVTAHGSIPEITWEPWNSHLDLKQDQPTYRLAEIAAGKHDDYIRHWASAISRYKEPVRIRFAHEMNGGWYPWGCFAHSNTPDSYVSAWRHVHDIFRDEGANNVKWIWSPVVLAEPSIAQCYPGNDYVDIVSVSGFNTGHGGSYIGTFQKSFENLKAIAPGKELAISETSCAPGPDRPAWVRDVILGAKAQGIKEIVWFNLDSSYGVGWRMDNDPATMQAMKEAL